jgi:hypothetical protein
MSEPRLTDPTPELADTPIADVRFLTRIRTVLAAAGRKTVGDGRETANDTVLVRISSRTGRIARNTLGLPSIGGVPPLLLPS